MRIIEDIRSSSETFDNMVITVGSFDGVHLGHQRIVREVLENARAIDGTAALMTLRPHPRQLFAPERAPNMLTGVAKKAELLDALGMDVVCVLPFTREVANLSAQDFVEQLLLDRCQAKVVIVGHDFCFGKDAQGDYEFLESIAPNHGFKVIQVAQLVVEGERVSSTLIRECVLQGEMDRAEVLLGRKYSVRGEVIPGRGMGVKLGFPTANIPPKNNALPAHGVYVAEAFLDSAPWPAAVNIGVAPTIRHEDTMIEAHLLGFEGDLVGKELEVVFHKRLRPEKKYDSHQALIEAIADDVNAVRRYFSQ